MTADAAADLDGFTIAEFAASMRLCERTIERGIRAGKYPVVIIAGKRRVPGSWVRALLAAAITTGCAVAEDHGRAWIAANGGA